MGLGNYPYPPIAFGSRQGLLIALQVFFVLIALVIYCLRLYTRSHILRSIGNDDRIMGIAMLLSIALAINACISTKYGWGKHLHEVPSTDFGSILLSIWLSEILFTLSTSFVKISILFFYLRIAVTKTYRQVIYGSIAFISIWALVFSCVVIFQCHPVSEFWNPISTQCYQPEIALFIHGLTNTITDIYIYVLPMKMVWKTHLPRRQRIGLLVIFGAGFLVCVAGALRLYFSILNEKSSDSTWGGFNLWTWESIEVNLAIICASTPSLKALIARHLPKLMPSHSATSKSETPAAPYQVNVRGGISNQPHFILESMGEARRNGERDRVSAESQQGLTKIHQHVLIAKVERDQMV